MVATAIWRRLLLQAQLRAISRTEPTAGSSIAARTVSTAITTSNSISVVAFRRGGEQAQAAAPSVDLGCVQDISGFLERYGATACSIKGTDLRAGDAHGV
jgi:hypothetical protein